ncbi:uncharacterized protein B0P05DRAFT_576666 [Gilbertella persicaria]|nr:uncharacterized protein B0P05DRAFT_576666 [Gilbertella persicaria]KAI8098334.1 hypothetical protein B0P05DRAFT_576666 [Gilbertella persicaria]
MSECNQVKSDGVCWLAKECIHLTNLALAYQTGVTNQAIQLFISNCHQLTHVDVSGCRLLTDHAFIPLINAVDDNLMKTTLETLNLSGLDSISATLIHQLLNKVYSLQELCLGVTYDLDEADRILDVVNSGGEIQFFIDYYTIYRLPASKKQKTRLRTLSHHERSTVLSNDTSVPIFSLPSASTWNLPPPVFPL